jgi:hypothetical protein
MPRSRELGSYRRGGAVPHSEEVERRYSSICLARWSGQGNVVVAREYGTAALRRSCASTAQCSGWSPSSIPATSNSTNCEFIPGHADFWTTVALHGAFELDLDTHLDYGRRPAAETGQLGADDEG